MKKIYVLLFGLLITTPAWAVGTMIVAAYYGVSMSAFTIGMTAAAMAINFAVSTIVTRVFGKKPPSMQDNGVRQQIPPSSVNSLPVVYGDAYLGGTYVDAVLSVNQQAMYYCLAISSISPNGQFTYDTTKIYYGDRLVTFDATETNKVISLTDGSGNVDTKITGHLYINLYTSSQSGTITPLNTALMPWDVFSSTRPTDPVDPSLVWTSTGRRMNGLAFAVITLGYNTDAGTTQLQPITFHCSHYLNSAGCAKPGDVWYDYITNANYGGAVDTTLVDSASATALNNYSDQLITYTPDGGGTATQPRYRINGVFDTGTSVLENIENLLTCCDSWMAYNAAQGQWSIVVNKAESTAMAFNDDNIIGDITVGTIDINQSVNQIEAKFPNKLNKDLPDYVYLQTPAGLLYPNEPVNKYTTNFSMTNDSVQAQYLANRILEQAREDLIVNIKTTYEGIQCNAGDVVSITNSSYGWDNKLFRVMKVNEASLPDGTLGATLELNEYNSEVYDDKDITEFTPASNSGLPAPQYFSSLLAPTVTSSSPSASVPTFNVQVYIPLTGRVTTGSLYYATTPTPSTSDWKLLDIATTTNSTPVANNTYYTFADLSLPSGTYYFAYTVGNEIGNSGLSPLSSAFTWSPTGSAGPTGPRSSSGYLYYALASQTAPSTPTASGYNFTTGTFSSLTSNWSTTFTAPDPVTNPSTEAGSKFWSCRYNVSEATYGGTQTVTLTAVFNWTNLDGLVTFTNVKAPSGTTFIDGGNIITDTVYANSIKSNTTTTQNSTYNYTSFGLGTTTTVGGYNAGGQFVSNNVNYFGLLVTNTGNGGGIGCGTTDTSGINSALSAVGYGNSTFSTFRSQGALGSGLAGGLFQHGGSQNLQSGIAAEIRLAYYTGGTAYAYYITAGGAYPFTAGHDGLQLLTETTPEIGDIMVDVAVISAPTVNDTITQMTQSTQANQTGVIGIFTGVAGNEFVPAALGEYIENPSNPEQAQIFVFKPEFANIYDTYRPIAVNSIGEGKVNVCGLGGNIAKGDLIVASTMAGKGMKQADDIIRGYTVAKSREDVIFDTPNQVKMIACVYVSG